MIRLGRNSDRNFDKLPSACVILRVQNNYVSVQPGTDEKWKSEKLESIFVWFDRTLARARDRQTVAQIILAERAACFLP